MKLFLLGSGTPILDKQRQSTTAILIDIGAEKILFDTGRGVTAQMLKQDLHPSSIGTIFTRIIIMITFVILGNSCLAHGTMGELIRSSFSVQTVHHTLLIHC